MAGVGPQAFHPLLKRFFYPHLLGMSKTVTYDVDKSMDDNLRANGLDPAEFMDEYNKWYAGLILAKLGVKTAVQGGANMTKVMIGVGVIVTGISVGMFLMSAPGSVPLAIAAKAACAVTPGLLYGTVPPNTALCLQAQMALANALTQAMHYAIATGTSTCVAGGGLILTGLDETNKEAVADMNKAFNNVKEGMDKQALADASNATKAIIIGNQAIEYQASQKQGALDALGTVAKVVVHTGVAVATGNPAAGLKAAEEALGGVERAVQRGERQLQPITTLLQNISKNGSSGTASTASAASTASISSSSSGSSSNKALLEDPATSSAATTPKPKTSAGEAMGMLGGNSKINNSSIIVEAALLLSGVSAEVSKLVGDGLKRNSQRGARRTFRKNRRSPF